MKKELSDGGKIDNLRRRIHLDYAIPYEVIGETLNPGMTEEEQKRLFETETGKRELEGIELSVVRVWKDTEKKVVVGMRTIEDKSVLSGFDIIRFAQNKTRHHLETYRALTDDFRTNFDREEWDKSK